MLIFTVVRRIMLSALCRLGPAGLAVGKVTHIDRQTFAPFARITCVPTAGIQTHRQVLLVPAAENVPPPPVPVKKTEKIPSDAPRKP